MRLIKIACEDDLMFDRELFSSSDSVGGRVLVLGVICISVGKSEYCEPGQSSSVYVDL